MSPSRKAATALLLLVLASSAPAQTKQLPLVWEYAAPKVFPQAILKDALGRDFLHVALKNGGLAILDISKPQAAPQQVAVVETAKLEELDVMHLTQRKDLLYLALGDFFNTGGAPTGLAIVSVAQPREPKVLSVWKSEKKLQGAAAVVVRDKYAYLGAMNHGVFILDISDPRKTTKAAEILPDVDFPLKNAGGLRVIDIENPQRPREVGRYINQGMGKKQQAYNNLVIDGTTAYVAIDYAGMEVLDIRDPQNIRQLAWWNPWEAHTLKNLWLNSSGHTNQIEYDAKQRLVYLAAGGSDLLVLDVSNRQEPKPAARYGEPNDKLGVWGLTLGGDQVYLAYINSTIPFQGTWSGIKAVQR